ncbi:TRI41 ligase, partial [Semnornis frantzii]|nr:TRI41 ligase [Semnornis frantzii]
DTAHPRLCLSLDLRSARLGRERVPEPRGSPKRFDSDFCVLGAPGFTGGRHYWEGEVGGRRGELWCVGSFGKRFQALTATEQTPLSPTERPRRLRVYLDYERGQLCFYNAESMAHIHTFRVCFRGRILP